MSTKDEIMVWIKEYTHEYRHHYLVHIRTMSKVFWQEPSMWRAGRHKIHTLNASSWQKAILWWVSRSSDAHNHYVFFCFLITQVGTGGGIFDDNTMIQEDARCTLCSTCKTHISHTCVLVTTYPSLKRGHIPCILHKKQETAAKKDETREHIKSHNFIM
jgi:hypothetical protein